MITNFTTNFTNSIKNPRRLTLGHYTHRVEKEARREPGIKQPPDGECPQRDNVRITGRSIMSYHLKNLPGSQWKKKDIPDRTPVSFMDYKKSSRLKKETGTTITVVGVEKRDSQESIPGVTPVWGSLYIVEGLTKGLSVFHSTKNEGEEREPLLEYRVKSGFFRRRVLDEN